MNDLVKEMRDLADEPIVTAPEGRALLRKGASEIERLRAENDRLKAAQSNILSVTDHDINSRRRLG